MLHDLRIALRGLRKTPGFALAVIATLALGIAANTAIFSVVYGVWLRPLPYQQPDRLAVVQTRLPALVQRPIPFSAPDVLDFARLTRAFEGVSCYSMNNTDLAAGGEAARVRVARISHGLFPLLGVSPLLGRHFTEEQDTRRVQVLLLSHALWQRQFGGDPTVIGKTVKLGLKPYVVTGVMPKGFQFPEPSMQASEVADLWVPMSLSAEEVAGRGDDFNYSVIARLRPGITWTQAREDADRTMAVIRQSYPAEIPKDIQLLAQVSPLPEEIVHNSKTLLGVLMGAVALLLLIACANVSNLLLIRSLARQREVSLRLSLGATRGRVARQFLTECLLLGLAGGSLGLLMAQSGLDLLIRLAPQDLPRLNEVSVDSTVLLFACALSLAATLAFGLAPSLAGSRQDLMTVLRAGSQGSMGSRGRTRLGNLFVAAQVALAVVLMVCSGLLMRTFFGLKNADPGFRTERVMTASVALSRVRYEGKSSAMRLYERLMERLSSTPGLDRVALATSLPMAGDWQRVFLVEGQNDPPKGTQPLCAHNVVTEGYFQTLGVALKRGRGFSIDDREDAEPSVVISESMAKRYFQGGDAVGRRMKWGVKETKTPWLKVIGVVADVKSQGLDREALPQTYTYWQQERAFAPDRIVRVALRTRGPAEQAAGVLRGVMRELDSEVAVADVWTMEQVVSEHLESRRFNMYLFGVFALAATLLAGIGVFGVMAHLVAQRTQEIGVRKALGAQGIDVLRLVVQRGLILVGAGLGAGLASALGLARLLQNLIYGVQPGDPLTLLSVCGLLALAALAACAVPAWRAMHVDPMSALRWE
jgi:predicted permease